MEIVEYEFSTHLISIKHTKTPYHPSCSEFAMPISDSRWRWYFRLLTGATLRENIFRLLPGGKISNRKMLRMIKQQHELTWTMQGWYQSLLISATKWGNSEDHGNKVEFRHALTVVVANPSSAAFYLWEFTERNRSPISGYLSLTNHPSSIVEFGGTTSPVSLVEASVQQVSRKGSARVGLEGPARKKVMLQWGE